MSGYAYAEPTPPRRRAIQLGVAAVVTAVAGGALYRTAHRTNGTTVSGALDAPSLGGGQARYEIVYPRHVDPRAPVAAGAGQGGRLPVVVVLHDLGGDAGVVTSSGLADALGRAVVQRDIPPFALAAISGGDRWWRRRPDGTDAGALVVDKFLPWLAQIGLAAGPTHRVGLVGVGMGGYGALRTAQRLLDGAGTASDGTTAGGGAAGGAAGGRPGVAAVAVTSPRLWTGAQDALARDPGVFADAADFDADDVRSAPDALAGVPVRADCASSDPYLAGARATLGALRPAVAPTVRPGAADEAFRQAVADAQVELFRTAFARVAS